MKNTNSIYGAFAWISIVTMATFAYLWATEGAAAYGLTTLAFAGLFTSCIAACLPREAQHKAGNVIEVDFSLSSFRKAA
ncbi:MAG: hypothetical protein Q4E65_04955 [Clostridia bacterium]|nr:hypothetical protein [Clostridia bacterium]